MGSNNTLTRFRVLKIDRMEPRELILLDDKREYTHDEIQQLVNLIDMGNRMRSGQRNNVGGVARVISAFGIVGEKLNSICKKLKFSSIIEFKCMNELPQRISKAIGCNT